MSWHGSICSIPTQLNVGLSHFLVKRQETAMSQRLLLGIRWLTVSFLLDSDGIARVHGMANVQAEELVE